MSLFLVGINHRTAPLDIRERIWLSAEETQDVTVAFAKKYFGECVVVSTCNRTEVYGVVNGEGVGIDHRDELGKSVSGDLIGFKSAAGKVSEKHFYMLNSYKAVGHLFKVASGIDSMVIGDIQILSQVKEAFSIAESSKTVGVFLKRLKQSTFHVAKRARSESSITEGAVSVGYAAVELANKVFADLSSKSALLIGAGETGELTAKHLVGRGIGSMLVSNRTRSKAEDLVATLGGRVVEFDALAESVSKVDIILSSISTEQFVLSKQDLRAVMKARGYRPLIIIDIGVPRNIDPAAKVIDNIFLYDMDALQGIVDQNLQRRKSEIPRVNAIILQELAAFREWVESLNAGPTISDLRERFEAIRRGEVAKHINRFSEGDREMVELVTKRIVNKLLHEPTTSLRNSSNKNSEEKLRMLQAVRELFGLSASRQASPEEE